MSKKYKAGDKAFIIESNRIIREVTIVRVSGGMYLVRFDNGGGIQVKEHRLYDSKEAAESAIKKENEPKKTGFRSPYDY